MALLPLPDECEAWLPDDSDLVAEEMRFGLGCNSTSTTKVKKQFLCEITRNLLKTKFCSTSSVLSFKAHFFQGNPS